MGEIDPNPPAPGTTWFDNAVWGVPYVESGLAGIGGWGPFTINISVLSGEFPSGLGLTWVVLSEYPVLAVQFFITGTPLSDHGTYLFTLLFEYSSMSYGSLPPIVYSTQELPCRIDVYGPAPSTSDSRSSSLSESMSASRSSSLSESASSSLSSSRSASASFAPGEYGFGSQYRLIRRLRQSPYLTTEQAWLFFSHFRLDLEAGRGSADGQGRIPMVMLQWSDNNGTTWSNEYWMSAGQMGQYRWHVDWTRLGRSRKRFWRVTMADPIAWRLLDAYVEVSKGNP